MRAARWLLPIAIATATASNACEKKQPPPPERTEPWPAQATSAEAEERIVAKYQIAPGSKTTVAANTRKQKNEGVISVVRGNLDVDLLDLSKTRGSIAVDVASIRMTSNEEPEQNVEHTQRAQNWLHVGASRPEALREKHRWAKFEIRSIESLSEAAAYRGKLQKKARPAPDAGDASVSPNLEVRRITLTAIGDLELNSARVEASAKLSAEFHYEDGASFDARPELIVIKSRSPVRVSLAAHDITPRVPMGVVIA